jgi:hypothetical protein
MGETDYTAEDWQLLIAAEARLDTALSRLLSKTEDVTDATRAQAEAVMELKKARNAIRILRDRMGKQG